MLEAHDQAITYCSFCPKMCRFACPVAHVEARETVTPQAKQALVDRVRRGDRELDAEVADIWYRCTGCQLHTTACKHEIEVGTVMFDARAEAVRAGVEPEAVRGLPQRLDADDARLRTLATEIDPDGHAGPVGYFAGCSALAGDGRLARAGLAAAAKHDQDVFAIPAGCCGYPLLASGHHEAFAERARQRAAELSALESVITGDPICAWTLRDAYPRFGVTIAASVKHIAELDIRPAARHDNVPTAYHDPCYLSRRLGVRDEPRAQIAEAIGARPIELPWSERGGWCSGGGGGLPDVVPETADAIAADLGDQVRQSGARRVVTACPRCHERLSGAAGEDLEVVDLAELLGEPAH